MMYKIKTQLTNTNKRIKIFLNRNMSKTSRKKNFYFIYSLLKNIFLFLPNVCINILCI